MGRLLEQVAKRCPGGNLPDTYLVFDTETGGFSPQQDRIVQAGFCFVRGHKLVDRFGFYIHRPDYRMSDGAINVHKITHEKLAAEGIPVADAVPLLVQTLSDWRKGGGMFVGHNMVNFDAPFVEYESAIFRNEFKFGPNEIIDTGMLVKGALLNMEFRNDQEDMRSFYKRVSEVRARGVHWSLDRYCYDAYDLGKYGVARDNAHDAAVDCELTHWLLQELYKR